MFILGERRRGCLSCLAPGDWLMVMGQSSAASAVVSHSSPIESANVTQRDLPTRNKELFTEYRYRDIGRVYIKLKLSLDPTT